MSLHVKVLIFLIINLFLQGQLFAANTLTVSKQKNCYTETVTVTSSFGNTSTYTLNWQYKTITSNWDSIKYMPCTVVKSGKNITLNSFTLADSFQIRCIYKRLSPAFDSISNTVAFKVLSNLTAAQISSQSIPLCYNTVPEAITITSPAGGSDGVFTYQWQESTDNITFTDISGATSLSYQAGTLIQTTFYRVVANSSYGCGSIASLSSKVEVYAPLSVDNISNQTICYNAIPELFIAVPHNGGNLYNYQWQESTNGSSFANIDGATSTSYQAGNLTSTHYYRVLVYSQKGCSTVLSNGIMVTVHNELLPGSININQTICYNTSPLSLVQNIMPTGGDGVYSYQWQSSPNNTSYSNISSQTTTQYQPGNMTSSRYYRLQVTSGSSCGTVITPSVLVTVLPDKVAAHISTVAVPICYNAIPEAITVTTPATGSDGNFSYQWQESIDNTIFTDIGGETSPTYQAGNLSLTKYYRIIATSTFGCGSLPSSSSKVEVYGQLAVDNISDQIICYNTSPALLTAVAHNGGNLYNYQWQESADGIGFANIDGATSNTYQAGNLLSTRIYRVLVFSQKGCSTIYSNQIHITVYDEFLAGSVINAQTICYNSIPNLLTQNIMPTGGDGSYNYLWQVSADNIVFSNISSETSNQFQPGNLISSKYYRMQVNSGSSCGTVYTPSVLINVLPDKVAAQVSKLDQPTCNNTIPGSLTIEIPATGSDGFFNYQWQQSSDNSVFNDISGETSQTYQAGNLTQTTYYRVMATSVFGCGAIPSASSKIEVYAPISVDDISSQIICYNSSPSILTAVARDGGNVYNYQWQESPEGTSFTDIIGATSSTFKDGALTLTKFYRVLVVSQKGCSFIYSNNIQVTVYDELFPGSVAGAQTICYNTSPAVLTQENLPVGGDGTYSYQWQASADSITFSNLLNQTAIQYQAGSLKSSLFYRIKVTSGSGCGIVNTPAVLVTVLPDKIAAEISVLPEPICFKTIPGALTVTKLATGADGTFTYQWQESTNNSVFTDIIGETSMIYQAGTLSETTYYRILANSSFGCGTIPSAGSKIEVYAQINVDNISNQTICFNTPPAIFTSVARDGGNLYNYQWQESDNGISYNEIDGSTQSTYQAGNLMLSHFYRVFVVSQKGCSSVYSNEIKVTVYDEIVPGTIENAQTICYNTSPQILAQKTLPSGGDGTYSYQWLKSSDNLGFADITSQTTIQYQPNKLIDTTFYSLKVTSGSGCGYKQTPSIIVNVLPDNTAPQVSTLAEPICYNTSPNELNVTQLATGSDGIFTYQWQTSTDNSSFNNIPGAEQLNYQPPSLTQNTFFSIVATSTFGCGSIASPSNKIEVYDALAADDPPKQTICYNTQPAQLLANAHGGGDTYSYQWQVSSDGIDYLDIPDANSAAFQPDSLLSSHFYRTYIVSLKGCFSVFSKGVNVSVYEELNPGTINGEQEVCYNENGQNLSFAIEPTGGKGNYSYLWQKSPEGVTWLDVPNQIGSTYLPESMITTTFYRLRTSDFCGFRYSNRVRVLVNPLPDTLSIAGDTCVCSNQHSVYSITQPLNPDYQYEWSIIGGFFQGIDTINVKDVSVKWDKSSLDNRLLIKQIIRQTGCNRIRDFKIVKKNSQSPDRKGIIRKSTSRILISLEKDTGIIYQWGYTNKINNSENFIENSNRRYVEFASSIDVGSFDYWVKTTLISNNDTCSAISKYVPDIAILGKESSNSYSIYPNPARKVIYIRKNSSGDTNYSATISSLSGVTLIKKDFKSFSTVDEPFNFNLPQGLYLIEISDSNDVITQKLLIY